MKSSHFIVLTTARILEDSTENTHLAMVLFHQSGTIRWVRGANQNTASHNIPQYILNLGQLTFTMYMPHSRNTWFVCVYCQW